MLATRTAHSKTRLRRRRAIKCPRTGHAWSNGAKERGTGRERREREKENKRERGRRKEASEQAREIKIKRGERDSEREKPEGEREN